MVISAQCLECERDVKSNKRGCGTLVKAQAPARVDVHTAFFSFAVRAKESNTCACGDQPIVILRGSDVKKVNAWIVHY